MAGAARYTALLDANVPNPASIRELLLSLAALWKAPEGNLAGEVRGSDRGQNYFYYRY